MLIDLSICIPTFNKSKFIFETLKSIENQKFGSNVEVVILDGASTDNTKEIIDLFKDKINNLRYYLENKNNGIDFDLDKTVHLAKGRYCWLMSSDDLMTTQSVQFILDKLNSNFDILISDIYYADVNMKIWGKSKFFNTDKSKLYDISKEKDLVNYIRDSTSNNALFCYMSNIVFLRKNWINFQSNIINYKTCYAHVFKLLSFSFNKKCEIIFLKIILMKINWNLN
jgi:abequosyltransferase